jgi:spore germination cell wall hydrolase CwlJ-like protein
LAKTLYGEARSESYADMVAVAWTIVNRYRAQTWYGRTVKEVCLKPWQYSCWNLNDANRAKMFVPSEQRAWHLCLAAARDVLWGGLLDPTGGATHYYDKSLDDNPPAWSRPPAVRVRLNYASDFRFFTHVP